MNRCILAVVSLLAALVVGYPATLLSQAIEWSMYVNVVDSSGAPVPNLGPADFVVREDNVSREVLRVEQASDPMQVAILVDTSTAARAQISNIRRALPPFLDTLTVPTASGRHNEVAIVGLGSRPTILAQYTIERASLDKAIGRIWEEDRSASYLLDGIIEVTQGFKKREAARPVIVAIITEGLELSSRSPDQVLKPLQETGTAFHVITLGQPSNSDTDAARFRNTVIEQGPRDSGGTRAQLLAGSALPAKLKQLGDVLTHTYRVIYAHRDSLIPPDRVTVTARRTELTAQGTLVKDSKARR